MIFVCAISGDLFGGIPMIFSQNSRCAVQFAMLGVTWNSVLYFVILKTNLLNNLIQLQFSKSFYLQKSERTNKKHLTFLQI